MLTKTDPIRSQALRQSADGEECTLRIPGSCNLRTDTTVLCHVSYLSSGMGTKPSDISACYGCLPCHAVIDGKAPRPPYMSDRDLEWVKGRAIVRTLERMAERGLIQIKGTKK